MIAGTTSVSIDVQIVDDDGQPVLGLVAAAFPPVSYSLGGTAPDVDIDPLTDLASIAAPYSAGGIKEREGGYYRLDLPNAALAEEGRLTLIGEATGLHLLASPIDIEGEDTPSGAITSIEDLYPFIRALLGDRRVMGAFLYRQEDLLSAVRSVFAFGRGPEGFLLAGSISSATSITPALTTGDPIALACYEAVKIMIGGEDGAKSIRTREITVSDSGHRKRDLLAEMEIQIYRIKSGGAVFSTRQSLTQFFAAGGLRWQDFTEFTLGTVPGSIRI